MGEHVTLTFDDGPHPDGTPAVLEALGDRRAIFFMVGEQVERYPDVAKQVADAGHEIALHGYRHRNQMRVTPRWLAEDLRRGAAAIADATGAEPTLYRPPYGIFTPAGLALTRSYELLLWSKWGRDWRARTTPEEIARLATRALRPGDVILLHDADWYSAPGSHRRTAAAVPMVLEKLQPTGSGSAASASNAGARSQSM
ncbi:MAG: peptidoglycan-N-acetylglucosamine deacetylase [Thermoleophilaceae bacterium]|jgi:peptidoglycan/xylan/chitin deacetylase (PgdA/CDA1 family)|nr:peptidoglycan-N-acetylglucosamine deacetylase [Thermoleophilaceae bacterium]MEA2471030.1 peptidoglycan-N-acetylglucosamine deacetylase [Thermoleophilaceae bacterium]